MNDLLPCPFCGSKAESDKGFSPRESARYVWCSNEDCGCCPRGRGERMFTPEEWNRRCPHRGEGGEMPINDPRAKLPEQQEARSNLPELLSLTTALRERDEAQSRVEELERELEIANHRRAEEQHYAEQYQRDWFTAKAEIERLRAHIGDSLEVLDSIRECLRQQAPERAERIKEMVNGYIERAQRTLTKEK